MFSRSQEYKLKVGGMTCNHCVGRVTKALEEVNGVTKVKVDLEAGEATVKGKAGETDQDQLMHSLLKLGYEVSPIE